MGANKEKTQKAIEDLMKNHNWSWAKEIDFRNRNNLKGDTIFYRGTQYNYKEFKDFSDQMAKSLIALGIKKGDVVPVCMSNIPEFVMLLRAISLIGAQANIFSEEFDKEYIEEIIKSTNSSVIFVSDDRYQEIKQSIENADIDKIILFSLADSLPCHIDPYASYDNKFYVFKNKVLDFKLENEKIIGKRDFLNYGKDIEKLEFADVGLDDVFITTYTSGSTNTTRPKGINHTNKSLIFMGRFHDPDLSGLPATHHIRVLAHIPTHSNTDIITSISDSIMQNCEVALEPIYNPDFFIYSLMINAPHFAPATKSFYIKMCKMLNTMEEFKNVKFKNTYIPTIVGEPKSPGEEKYINKTLKKAQFGTAKIPKPLSPVPISFGGGDCEHGGLYFTLWVKYLKALNSVFKHEEIGLIPFNGVVETVCLGENGELLKENELGILAVNSPCTMKEYNNNPEETEKFYVTDEHGKKHANLNVYGYIDRLGTIHMKGRVGANLKTTNYEIPLFMIKDIIEKDTKNILSAEVVIKDNIGIAHIEPMPGITLTEEKIRNVGRRIINEMPCELLENMLFRIRTNEEGFPLTGCGKRNNLALESEELSEDLIKMELFGDEINIIYPYKHLEATRKREK